MEMSHMKGQELKRINTQTRTQRRKQEHKRALLRVTWYTVGIVLTLTLMTHYSLWTPGAVLAVLGGVEVVAKTWRAIWDWLGA